MTTRLVNCTRVQLKRLVFPIQHRCISNSRIAMAPTITDAITKDHRELEDYYNKILTASTDKEKAQWQNQFTWELARHSHGEELVVYPVFEKSLADGQAMADKDRREHTTVQPYVQLHTS